MISAFDEGDYKAIIRRFIHSQPNNGRGLIKAFAAHLGIDPSQVSQVLSGTKDFTEEQGISLAKFIGLNELETDYFLTLLKIERSSSRLLKDHYLKKRDKLKEESLDLSRRLDQDRILTDFEKAIFYSHYIYSAVRLSTSIGEGLTLTEVASRFQLSRERASEVLNFLVSTGLCIEKNGRYALGTQHTHVERGSPFLTRHHHNWRVRALQKTDSISEQELQFTGPVSISRTDFEKVREQLVEVISNALKTVKQSEPEDVAVLLIDWFWLK
jgi:uncharacterized protein (TIGR02147 family)